MIKNNYNKPNSRTAKKLLKGIKGLCASLAGMALIQSNHVLLDSVLITGFVLTEIINFISSDEVDKEDELESN